MGMTSISELVKEMIAICKLDEEYSFARIRQKIMRECREIPYQGKTLWDITLRPTPTGTKVHQFTEDERRLLFENADFSRVIGEGTEEYQETIADVRKYRAQADQWNSERNERLENVDWDKFRKEVECSETQKVKDDELWKQAYRFITLALYEIFYEPFDFELLAHDMGYKFSESMSEYTPEMIRAIERLSDYKSYCKRKETTKEQ